MRHERRAATLIAELVAGEVEILPQVVRGLHVERIGSFESHALPVRVRERHPTDVALFKLNANYLMTGEGALVPDDPAEGNAPQASAQEKVERLLATIESQQRTIEILARKLG